jgi:hypothetical protein
MRAQMNELVQQDLYSSQSGCVLGNLNETLPYWIRTSYMGAEVAKEVVAAWYRCLPETGEFPGISTNFTAEMERAASKDIFRVGIDPAKVLRRLDIALVLPLGELHDWQNPEDIAAY